MHFRHHLPLLLLVAWGLVDVGILMTFIVLDATGSARSVPWDPIIVGLVTVQGSAAQAWLYLSGEWAGLHVVSLLVLVLCVAVCIPLAAIATIAVHLFVLALVNYPLAVLHDSGWRYRFHPTTPEERKPWQFSLGGLIGLTFVVAACLGLWQPVGWLAIPKFENQATDLVRTVIVFGALAWVPAIRVLVGIAQSRYTITAAAILGAIYLRLLTIYLPDYLPGRGLVLLVVVTVGALVLTLQAAALRWAGWRIERDPRRRQPRSAPEPKPPPPDVADAVHAGDESGMAAP